MAICISFFVLWFGATLRAAAPAQADWGENRGLRRRKLIQPADPLFSFKRLHMPLPNAPTQKPAPGKAAVASAKANNELAMKGILLTMIGLGVLVSPYFITSPGMQGIVAKSTLVGWFALVLGIAFLGVFFKRRMAASSGS